MKIIYMLLLLIGATWGATAQKVVLSGKVQDEKGNVLEMANVIAYKNSGTEMVAYGISNDQGKYKLVVPGDAMYTLKVSYLGLTADDREIKVSKTDQTIDFIMKADENSLDEVELVYEMPVVVKGDTVVYNTDSFTNGAEKKLGDVLKKLPGIEVTENGEIEVEGKKVSKVMVEGKDFFDGNSKLATGNIPADALDKVEVLRNYEEVDQMRGLSNSQDQVAINVKLKEGKKNFWFGDVKAGAGVGNTERHLVKPKLFYYNPAYSLNLLGDINDIGEVPFTLHDYFNFTGGLRNLEKGGTSLDFSLDNIGLSLLGNNRAREVATKFGAANFSYNKIKGLDISGYSIFNKTRTSLLTNIRRLYIDNTPSDTDNTIEEVTQAAEQNNQIGMLKLNAVYKPSTKLRIDYDLLGKISSLEETSSFLSRREEAIEDIRENGENKPASLTQNINAYYTATTKDVFSFSAQHLLQKEIPLYNAIRDDIPFRGVFTTIHNPIDPTQDTFYPLKQSDRYDINQEKEIRTNKLDSRLDYYRVLTKKSNLNFYAGNTLSHQRFTSRIFQQLEEEENTFADNEFANQVTYGFLDTYLGLRYKFIKGIFTINPGISLHNYQLRDEQLGTTEVRKSWKLLPDFFATARLKKNETVNFRYQMTANYTDVNKLALGYVFDSYNALYRGNRNLENALYNDLSLSYHSFNMFNHTTVYAYAKYTHRQNPIKNTSVISGINQVHTPVNSNFADEVFAAMGEFSRSFGKVKGKLRANVNNAWYNTIVNGDASKSTSFTQEYEIAGSTNFKQGPNVDIGYKLAINEYNNNGAKNVFYTKQPYVKLEWQFLKGFLWNASYNYFLYQNKERTLNEYGILNGEISYQKPQGKWEYAISATNLLNTAYIYQDHFNEVYNSTSQYAIQPRYWMFGITYNL
ncbi:carboxypeptidase-like regulatory domain-containing protein [Aquimarina hainanensis]|uniref:Carboxypeptidase-like regulatory domain-containing protein n=1 Tax=Aquimarina hainanensis TaxID=1578017 RepID=A0ABW5N8D1_9FLAO